ncbi:MAG: glycosyltransferase, partial [Gemmatimonadetes bacterium]|nr:glycosyltransferase family 2 protein [Gemmatimonadota bacterium]NIR78974.1 glycosyltransferase family 2 protein [Gemmatimonadota bacterium]NIT87623.1 glycosyltransferase family 2 protein [Gemmatimonadota bacterium]NIU31485.1 glycosyltransferase family 2 protein [Gemmatimonadota bacterium]NIU36152.1 glycosyltransferase [Gemmatimonadota bacterium]
MSGPDRAGRHGGAAAEGAGGDEAGASLGLSVVIVSWNTRELLRSCLASLRAEAQGLALDVWVVDNASEDGSPEMVEEEFPEVRLLRSGENVGFAAANNRALRRIDAPFVLLLNPDTEVREGALKRALEAARSRGTTVAARLLNPDGSLQHSCFRFPRLGVDLVEALYLHLLLPRRVRGPLLLGGHWAHDEAREVDWALGAFLLVPGTAVEDAGLLPEEYPLFGEDIEWCWRLGRMGYPVRFCPDAEVVHHGNQA